MRLIRLLGNPVSHSKSPQFQNAGIRARGLNARYERYLVDDASAFAALASQCRAGRFFGANITLPYKSEAASHADRRTDDVDFIGVANTWWTRDGELIADNTDIYGVQASIAAMNLRDAAHVVVLGAGGAAVGACYALRHVTESVIVINRTLARAEDLARQLRPVVAKSCEIATVAWPRDADADAAVSLKASFARADLVVQATSMPVNRPDLTAPFEVFPWGALSRDAGLLELSYAPRPTVAMRCADAVDVRNCDGATMLLHQGARSFERWFGGDAPVETMRDALAQALGRRPESIAAAVSSAAMKSLRGEG